MEIHKPRNNRPRISAGAPVIRPGCDVHIIYGTDVGSDDHVQLVTLLQAELDNHDYKHTDCGRDCLPGQSTNQQHIDMITQADFIVCFISHCQQTGEVTPELIHHIRKALTIKQRAGLPNRVIPVFCNMTEEHIMEIRDAHLPEMILVSHITARQVDFTYIEKVMQALEATPSGENIIIF